MRTEPTPARTPGKTSAIHAVVAVLLALVVSATAPLGGSAKERVETDVRLVQCSAEHAAAIRVAVLPDCQRSGLDECLGSANASTQIIRATERTRWMSALPPPVRA